MSGEFADALGLAAGGARGGRHLMTTSVLRHHGLTVKTEPTRGGLTRISATYGTHSILAFAGPDDDLAREIDRAIYDALWDLPAFVEAGGRCQGGHKCRRAGRVVRFVNDVPQLRCWQHL